MKSPEDVLEALKSVEDPRTLDDLVYLVLMLVPIGRVVSYSALAKVVGTSPRRIGLAMARNRGAPVIPCHRVVKKDGSLGGYSLGGVEVKARLLEIEGIAVDRRSMRIPREALFDEELIKALGLDK